MKQISLKGAVAYVEIETFGGSGEKHAIVYRDGAVILGPSHREDTVNHALHFIGVQSVPLRSVALLSEDFSARKLNYANGEHDEFDQLNLGRHRFTRDWIDELGYTVGEHAVPEAPTSQQPTMNV